MGNMFGNLGSLFTPTKIIIVVGIVIAFIVIRAAMGGKFGRPTRRR